jgi:hypothetical protein
MRSKEADGTWRLCLELAATQQGSRDYRSGFAAPAGKDNVGASEARREEGNVGVAVDPVRSGIDRTPVTPKPPPVSQGIV